MKSKGKNFLHVFNVIVRLLFILVLSVAVLTSSTPLVTDAYSASLKNLSISEQIKLMDRKNLSQEDKSILFSIVQDSMVLEYGDLLNNERLAMIPSHIQALSTEECRAIFESYGSAYRSTTAGFYDPNTEIAYVDVQRVKGISGLLAAMNHEALHLLSEGGLNGDIKDSQGTLVHHVNRNLDEGITEFLTIEPWNY